MTKFELAKIVLNESERNKVDYALPQDWVDDITRLGIDPRPFYVWSYIENTTFGKPLNLAELYLKDKRSAVEKRH